MLLLAAVCAAADPFTAAGAAPGLSACSKQRLRLHGSF
jgi:hypothetical protein